MRKIKFPIILSFIAVLVFLTERAAAQPDNFYSGKTIRVVVGYATGTTTDQWARTFARHAAKYLAGNPVLLVQNMAGASSMIAANHLYAVAKPDGLTIGFIAPALYFDQLIGRKEAQFDWSKFNWIGSPTRSNELLFVRSDSPYKTVEDIRKASEPAKCGATGTASSGYYIPLMLEETLGMKFNIISGYQGGSDVDLAIERGEIQCRAFSISAFFAREPFHTWRKKGFVRVLLQTGMNREANVADVPTIYELMKQYQTPQRSQRLATVILAAGDIGRPIVAPPGAGTGASQGFAQRLREDRGRCGIQSRGAEAKSCLGPELGRGTGSDRQRSDRPTCGSRRATQENPRGIGSVIKQVWLSQALVALK
jgi:tripartite-type tricarboxylate transporter receptor subunit TctC